MKICSKCKVEKTDENFYLTSRGVLSVNCFDCKRAYEREYRLNNNKRKACQKKSVEKRKHENLKFIANHFKSNPCVDCGETDIIVLEFDHQRDKKYPIADMMGNYSLEKVKAEIEKCVVRCANCHRRKTALERKYKILDFV